MPAQQPGRVGGRETARVQRGGEVALDLGGRGLRPVRARQPVQQRGAEQPQLRRARVGPHEADALVAQPPEQLGPAHPVPGDPPRGPLRAATTTGETATGALSATAASPAVSWLVAASHRSGRGPTSASASVSSDQPSARCSRARISAVRAAYT
ncbi:hypothetical protein BJF78_33540 [Pseudonocardia sp. CNS-139]|nr:hypothetical protein BJF78_33540 [Pseudonocardia sp. CNS-139]